MPIYEYLCPRCGQRFEAIRRISERTNAPPCPGCGDGTAGLAVSAAAVLGGGGGGSGAACSTSAWTGGG
jgi:putative FmdB family regulatory protein